MHRGALLAVNGRWPVQMANHKMKDNEVDNRRGLAGATSVLAPRRHRREAGPVADKLGAVMASRPQIEAALGKCPKTLQLTEFSGVGLDVREWDLGLAVKKENDALAKALEQAMQALKADGTLQKIFANNGVSYRSPA